VYKGNCNGEMDGWVSWWAEVADEWTGVQMDRWKGCQKWGM